MFIIVPAGDCRVAIGKTIEELKAKAGEDKEIIRAGSFKAIHDGAVHNGLKPTPDDINKMTAMADRDVDHMMGTHPSVELLEALAIYQRMLLCNTDIEVAVDEVAFELFGHHLGQQATTEEAAA